MQLRPMLVTLLAAGSMAVAAVAAAAAEPDIIDAVKAADRARVERLVAGGADVDAPQGDGATALHWAAHRDLAEVAALLVRAGAAVDAADDHGVTPLALACLNASDAMVGLLLEAGADPNLRDDERRHAPDDRRPRRQRGCRPAVAAGGGRPGRGGVGARSDRADVGGGRGPHAGCGGAARDRRRCDHPIRERLHAAPLRGAAGQRRGRPAPARSRRRRRRGGAGRHRRRHQRASALPGGQRGVRPDGRPRQRSCRHGALPPRARRRPEPRRHGPDAAPLRRAAGDAGRSSRRCWRPARTRTPASGSRCRSSRAASGRTTGSRLPPPGPPPSSSRRASATSRACGSWSMRGPTRS